MGLTDKIFRTRFKEHSQAIETNKGNSKFAQHILDTEYTHDTIEKTLDVQWYLGIRP
jgi:hypothetical protein